MLRNNKNVCLDGLFKWGNQTKRKKKLFIKSCALDTSCTHFNAFTVCSGFQDFVKKKRQNKKGLCLVPRTCARVCSVADESHSFHRAQDFWVHRRSSSVGNRKMSSDRNCQFKVLCKIKRGTLTQGKP